MLTKRALEYMEREKIKACPLRFSMALGINMEPRTYLVQRHYPDPETGEMTVEKPGAICTSISEVDEADSFKCIQNVCEWWLDEVQRCSLPFL